jgi:hypothetical protein
VLGLALFVVGCFALFVCSCSCVLIASAVYALLLLFIIFTQGLHPRLLVAHRVPINLDNNINVL